MYWVPILSLSKYGKIATVQELKNAQNKYCVTLKQHIQTNMDIINLENKTNYPVSPHDMCLNKCMYPTSTSISGVAIGIEMSDKDQLLPEMAKAIRQESVSTKSEHYREHMQCGTGYTQGRKRIGGIKVEIRELDEIILEFRERTLLIFLSSE